MEEEKTYDEPMLPGDDESIAETKDETEGAVCESAVEEGLLPSGTVEPITDCPDISAGDHSDGMISGDLLEDSHPEQSAENASEANEEFISDLHEEAPTVSQEESEEDEVDQTGEEGLSDLISSRLGDIADSERRIFAEIREMHKLYHTEFAGRLKSMQDELDQYRKVDKGRAYDDILAAIARIYGTNETLEDEVTEPKAKKSIRYMLLDLEELLEAYGMSKLRSSEGEKRNPRHCQILNRIPTDNPDQHDTVAKSYNSGFHIGNRTVIKEMVDIYYYEDRADSADTEDNAIDENVGDSSSE